MQKTPNEFVAERLNIRARDQNVWSLTAFGSGKRCMIAFHGFADRGSLWEVLSPSLRDQFTVYAVDLPHHGQTHWPSGTFHADDIRDVIDKIKSLHQVESYTLSGYSLGGRIVQHVVEQKHNDVDALWLFAPDGVSTLGVYDMTRLPLWLRRLGQFALKRPAWFFLILKTARKTRLITQFIYEFTYNHLHTDERRQRLFNVWISMRAFQFSKKTIASSFSKLLIPTVAFFGERDEVIPPCSADELRSYIPHVKTYTVEDGHQLIQPELNVLINEYLQTRTNAS